MIEINKAPNHVAAFRLRGTVEEADIRRMSEAINGALERHDAIALLIETDGVSGFTGQALAADLRYEFSHLREFGRIRRVAVVTDTDWIAAAARAEAWLLPSLGMKVFPTAERAAADAHVAEMPAATVAPSEPGLRMLATDNPKVLAFELNGRMTADGLKAVTELLREAFAQDGKVDVLNRIRRFDGMQVSALADTSLLAMKREALSKVGRYAVVGGPDWMGHMMGLMAPVLAIELRHFPAERENEAWAWLGANPA